MGQMTPPFFAGGLDPKNGGLSIAAEVLPVCDDEDGYSLSEKDTSPVLLSPSGVSVFCDE